MACRGHAVGPRRLAVWHAVGGASAGTGDSPPLPLLLLPLRLPLLPLPLLTLPLLSLPLPLPSLAVPASTPPPLPRRGLWPQWRRR